MADQYVETTTKGLGSRLMDSIKGVVIGLILFIASFVLLYWNEGREGLAPLANTASEITADSLNTDTSLNGKLVSVTGKLTTAEKLGDELYLLPGDYFALNRKVEMFAWVEDQKTESNTNLGGSETSTTTYDYSKDWENSPEDSNNFKYPAGHANLVKSLEDKKNTVTTAQVGVYNIAPKDLDLPSFTDLTLSKEIVTLANNAVLAGSSFIYISLAGAQGSFENPAIGDLRISYTVLLPDDEVTVFGKLEQEQIKKFTSSEGQSLYRMLEGDRAAAIALIAQEDTTILWVLRIVGFLMMWFGLGSLLAPLTTLGDIVPIIGTLGRSVVSVITFIISLVLSIVTIIVSRILHNPLALVITVVVIVGGVVLILTRKKAQAK